MCGQMITQQLGGVVAIESKQEVLHTDGAKALKNGILKFCR
jgi:hypothetical protein